MSRAERSPVVSHIRPEAKLHSEIVTQLSDEARNYLYYRQDGVLFVSKTHSFNPLVTSFEGRLKRLGMPFQLQYVELAVVAQMRDAQATIQGDRTASDMQRNAKQLFEKAVDMRASDIHIRCSMTNATSIHMRVHGDLRFVEEHPYEYGEQLCSAIYHAMADVSDTTFEPMSRQDARIADRTKLPKRIDGIRIATTPQVDGFVMVMRLLYNDTVDSYDLQDLGYSREQKAAIELMKRRPIGINIIAGPTGSGKSTTLQRVLGSIVRETRGSKHVITVEDPPELQIAGTIQTPVTNADTEEERSRQFQAAIKSAMRLDPDVIMIGEIRDAASATLAMRAAMTGHQVWSTLHANGAFAIIDRLLDIGIPLEILTDHTIISGLTCQRLIKVLCPHCKKKLSDVSGRYSDADMRRVMMIGDIDNIYVTGDGCEECLHTGTSGRTVVAETVITDATMMVHIRNRDRIAAINYWKGDQQGQTMLLHAIKKILKGIVDPFAAEDIVGPLSLDLIEKDHRISQVEVNSVVS